MKHFSRNFLLILLLTLITTPSYSQLKMGVKFGLSVPNENLSKISTNIQDSVGNKKNVSQTFLDESRSGYHLIATAYIDLGTDFDLICSIGINRFTESKTELRDSPDTTRIIATLLNSRNIIPIEIGAKYKIVEIGFVSLYTIGNISYNYISTSTDVDYNVGFTSFGYPIQTSQTDRRIGYGIGAGLQLDFKLIKGFLEFKTNGANLIGKSDGESFKNFYTISAGVIL